MHGRIFWELRNYSERYGPATWNAIVKTAKLEDRIYLGQAYPDAEIMALLAAASSVLGKPLPALLEDFGAFTVPALMSMYGHLMRPEWRTLDVIEHTEKIAHGAVRLKEAGTAPPFLRTSRVSSDMLVLTYSSPRKFCAFAVGVGRGLAAHFGETIAIQQAVCMHEGANRCEITYATSLTKPGRALALRSTLVHT
jgi:hypothetical protein